MNREKWNDINDDDTDNKMSNNNWEKIKSMYISLNTSPGKRSFLPLAYWLLLWTEVFRVRQKDKLLYWSKHKRTW